MASQINANRDLHAFKSSDNKLTNLDQLKLNLAYVKQICYATLGCSSLRVSPIVSSCYYNFIFHSIHTALRRRLVAGNKL